MMSKLLKKNNKGFTLMEMLIVVAIIAILVAIMIPTFNSQLEKAREAADIANIRSAYAEAMVNALDSSDGKGTAETPAMTQTVTGWTKITWPTYLGTKLDVTKGNVVTVTVDTTKDPATVSCALGTASTQTQEGNADQGNTGN